jgi:hypothetical protein
MWSAAPKSGSLYPKARNSSLKYRREIAGTSTPALYEHALCLPCGSRRSAVGRNRVGSCGLRHTIATRIRRSRVIHAVILEKAAAVLFLPDLSQYECRDGLFWSTSVPFVVVFNDWGEKCCTANYASDLSRRRSSQPYKAQTPACLRPLTRRIPSMAQALPTY